MRFYIKLHLKSGKTIRLAVVEATWKKGGFTGEFTKFAWTHPKRTLRRLRTVDLTRIEAITRGFF